MPDVYTGLKKISDQIGTEQEAETLEKEFRNMPSQSIDYGIMEKAQDIFIPVSYTHLQ